MLVSLQEQELCRQLRDLPKKYHYRYSDEASRELLQLLFRSLAGRGEYAALFFPGGLPTDPDQPWSLRDAQGAVEGAEYTEAARGKPCGHIFKSGEATYRCKTCTADETCVLCARCFDASDHEDHTVYVSVSPGNSGCCDCGDDEAWNRPLHCNIHSANAASESKAAGKAKEGSTLPGDLQASIRMTIARALDYLIDVFSCSPEQLRLPKTEQSIVVDERTSRLTSKWYGEEKEPIPEEQEFALVLWNDEKHTVYDVRDQVARACKQKKQFGLSKAYEVGEIGRSTIVFSTDIRELLRMAKVIEEIKLTVTIRSSRDTFREQMCATIIEWISDISGCSVGNDTNILRHTICEEMLKPWRIGSEASHQQIGRDGIDDHQIEDDEDERIGPFITRIIRRQNRAAAAAQRRADGTTEEATASDEDGDDEGESAADATEEMDIDSVAAQDNDGDVDMDAYESPDEALEVSEATIAGYPPPPPPPLGPLGARRPHDQNLTPADSDGETMLHTPHPSHMEPSLQVPETPRIRPLPLRPPRPPKYWLEKPDGYGKQGGIPAHEDLLQRLRLDFMILFDLRMWKKVRIDVREVFICTVVTIPHFKRLLGLRFAGVYTTLAQLYLIADREPDHSIINLSLQMLTTPSITAEVVERGNFLTNLMAILYTFLTTRQVGYPWNVDPKATLAFEQGAVTNRRMYHFFLDMKYLLGSEHVQERIREEGRYLLQFLDLVKLHQGICPNVRAVGEHLEYETDAWISASLITREINRLCRQFSEAFSWHREEDPTNIRRAIRWTARVAIINSLGAERNRFDQAEIKNEVRFKTLDVFEFDAETATFFGPTYKIVDFVVANEPMSFHHALHYTLSWLIDRARSMPRENLVSLLTFTFPELKEPYAPQGALIGDYQPEEYLLALFDFPLRVCAWLAQMRASMWVRNGITLRHQMSQYRNVAQRDVSYQRDIFLLQTALVVCNPSVFLATMVDRFGLMDWIKGRYENQAGFEDSQVVEVAEDFVHLLIILLSDRTSLVPVEDEVDHHIRTMRRDIAHILCFKPLSYSELTSRLSDKVQNTDEFSEVLSEMTRFRAPEGLSDTGTFELKEQYLELVDPYILQYTRNQREEAETIYKNFMAKRTGKPAADIVFEPKLQPINSGAFKDLSNFTRTPVFTQIIYYLLGYALVSQTVTPHIPLTRVEAYVQFVLQLLLVAVLEDKSEQHEWSQPAPESFVTSVLTKHANVGLNGRPTILSLLKSIAEIEEFKSCEPKIKLIFHRLKQRQQHTFIISSEALHMAVDRMDTASPASGGNLAEKELKKKQALERQARVMASFKAQQDKFMVNHDIDLDKEDFSDLEGEFSTPAEEEKVMKYPSGTCILCQEETDDQRLYGTFGYVSDSAILRQTDTNDDDWVDEVTQTPASLDRSAESVRPFGVAGKNRRMVQKVNANGETVLVERQTLGKGFPRSHVQRGPVTIGCGHIMHYSCFEVYLQATQRRHVSQIARNHPERPDQKEFMCPLCKALGNMFLPIIWKGKTATYPGCMEAEVPFEEWIDSQVAINISKLDKSPERPSGEPPANLTRQQKAFFEYGDKEFTAVVATRLPDIVKPTFITSLSIPPRPPRNQFQVPAFIPVGGQEDPRDPIVLPSENSNPGMAQSMAMVELIRIYQRLRDTFRSNHISTEFGYPHTPSSAVEDLTYTDSLARTLGFSIAATEIAQRGVQSESVRGTLLDKISPQTLTHLRVYSETVNSYIAVGSLRNGGSTKTMQEYLAAQNRQLHQLFIGHPNIFDPEILPYDLKGTAPLLAQDAFIFLTECSVCAVPALNLDIHHVLRLCYLAEIVRVVITFATDISNDGAEGSEHIKVEEGEQSFFQGSRRMDVARFINPEKTNHGSLTTEQMDNILFFVTRVVSVANLHQHPDSTAADEVEFQLPTGFNDPAFLHFIYTMISTYALTFLRKAAILMHVRYGIEFPYVPYENVDQPEIDRLSYLLKLPTLDSIFSTFKSSYATRAVVGGWIRHWVWAREGKRPLQPALRLSHPAIFELVGLPKNYDTLTDEAIRRKCPTTGKDLTDPCVCLFCGELFCSQGVCCMKDKNKGGCFQHQEKCGGNIGLYINIRKCMVLFLNQQNGTWAVAPYLDKHGEVDPTLRRHHQLFLNQKRYDILLRLVWLGHGIPSTIARRLEGDVNTGGWETL